MSQLGEIIIKNKHIYPVKQTNKHFFRKKDTFNALLGSVELGQLVREYLREDFTHTNKPAPEIT